MKSAKHKGFTILELLVAVSVTALLAAMLLNITSQVVSTQTKAAGDLETNQAAQFILDRIQEDLQCALSRNDGNVWMAARILIDEKNSGEWKKSKTINKPEQESLRVFTQDWSNEQRSLQMEEEGQGSFLDSRFGVGGIWLRFFTQAPELDPSANNKGGVRAIGYQIIRHGLTGASSSRARYQLFRSDVNSENTFTAGYNLHPLDGNYQLEGTNNQRSYQNLINPIFDKSTGEKSTGFALASNVIDFGIRAYLIDKKQDGTGSLQQIFPNTDNPNHDYEYLASTHSGYRVDSERPLLNAFPEVVDIMVRILTTEGESAINALEEGLIPIPSGSTPNEYWWETAEKYSEVYIRRIKVFSQSI